MSISSPRCTSRAALAPILCAAFLTAASVPSASAQVQARKYTEARGSLVSTVEYRTSRDGQSILLSTIGGESTDVIRWTVGSGAAEWHFIDTRAGSDFRALRTGNAIHVSGTLKGRAVDRQVKVDGAPWYQLFGPLIDELLPAGRAQREFWVLDPSDLASHKMQVKRAGTERVTVHGTPVDAVKIHFSPAGALAAFWGADFWYRKGDGLWVTSRLPEGGTVTVSTVEELTP